MNNEKALDLESRSASVDGIVREAFERLFAASVPEGLALLAVGGYGRRQLFPHSDVDLLLLFRDQGQPSAHQREAAAFIQRLWDSGLRVSHSSRTPAECSELNDENVELNVSLLDQRFLAGDGRVYAALMQKLPRFISAQRDSLVRHLCRMTRERHAQHGDTFHHLEPNIKEAPGGLRDLQFLSWLPQIQRTTPSEFARPEPPPEHEPARQWLFTVRCRLHLDSRRDNNVLAFDAQERLFPTPAQGMGEYFRAARGIYRSTLRLLEASEARSSSLFAQFRSSRSRLSTAEFTVSRDRVFFREPGQLASNPLLALRLFEFVARHGILPAAEAGERLAAHLDGIREYFRASRPVWSFIEGMLSLPHAAAALRAMHETGMLTAVFPELEPIECLVIRDFHHRYTVDEHTLVAIQAVTQPPPVPFSGLYLEIEKPALLLFALLFHDAGKAAAGAGHETLSVQAAESAMDRIQTPDRDRETVRLLITSHLEMSAVMQKRDLSDPETGRYMAQQAGTVELLKYLTLLTWADISAVNPTAMTPWRAEQLWQLYLVTYNELTRELDTGRIPPGDVSEPFLEGFPVRYVRTHSPDEIAAHRKLEKASQDSGVAADLARTGFAWRLTLLARDRPFLFASVAGTLSSFGMNILKAEAYANRHGTVLDTFTFEDPIRTLELNPPEVERLKATVERVLLGRADVKQLLKGRPRSAPRGMPFEPSVDINNDASESATLIQIVAADRPALLYDLASTLSAQGCNIEVVLIDTEAHKAIDVFYVTSGGGKLDSGMQESLRQALHHAIR